MKTLLIVIGLLSFVTLSIATEQHKGELQVMISGVKNGKGKVEIYLFNNEAQFEDKVPPLLICKAKITRLSAECTFADIAYGNYAIFAFHDENQNGMLDVSLLGDPEEKLAISGIDLATNSAPSFNDSQFVFNSQRGQVFINLQ